MDHDSYLTRLKQTRAPEATSTLQARILAQATALPQKQKMRLALKFPVLAPAQIASGLSDFGLSLRYDVRVQIAALFLCLSAGYGVYHTQQVGQRDAAMARLDADESISEADPVLGGSL